MNGAVGVPELAVLETNGGMREFTGLCKAADPGCTSITLTALTMASCIFFKGMTSTFNICGAWNEIKEAKKT